MCLQGKGVNQERENLGNMTPGTEEGNSLTYGEMKSHGCCVTHLEMHHPRLEQDRGLQEGCL